MTTPRLPYKDDSLEWEGVSDSPALNEWRGLREAYALKAKAALAKRYHCQEATWDDMLEKCKIVPAGFANGLLLLASMIGDIKDWSMITRFVWLCDKVWTMECDELAKRMSTSSL